MNQIWSYLEDINSWKDGAINVDIKTLLICTQQTVLLLGQTNNSVLYYRRYNALSFVMPCHSDSKMVLNDHSDEMSEETYLFGKKNRSYTSYNKRAKTQTMVIPKPFQHCKALSIRSLTRKFAEKWWRRRWKWGVGAEKIPVSMQE